MFPYPVKTQPHLEWSLIRTILAHELSLRMLIERVSFQSIFSVCFIFTKFATESQFRCWCLNMMSYSQVFLQILFQHSPLADIALFTLFFWIEVLPLLVAPEPPGGGGDVVAVLAGEEDTARVEVL